MAQQTKLVSPRTATPNHTNANASSPPNRPLPTLPSIPRSKSPPIAKPTLPRPQSAIESHARHFPPVVSSNSNSSSSSHQQKSSSSSSSGSYNSRPEEHEIKRTIRPTEPRPPERGYSSDPDTPPRHHHAASFHIKKVNVRRPGRTTNRRNPRPRTVVPTKAMAKPTRSQLPRRRKSSDGEDLSRHPRPHLRHNSSEPLYTAASDIPPPPPLPEAWASERAEAKHQHASTITGAIHIGNIPTRSEPLLGGPLGPPRAPERVERANLNVPGRRGRTEDLVFRPKQRMNDCTKWKRGSLIGVGSFGKVYMAMNTETGELLAVKQIPTVNTSEAALAQLENEVSIMRTLSHPHIVALFGIQQTDEHLNILMEYVPGKSLDTIYKDFGPLSEETIQKYLYQCIEGLAFAHENYVIHRDIKGKNILVDNRGVIKLADFGSAKVLDATMASELQPSMGYQYTPLWTAPEVMLGNYDERVDVWSIGCTVIEIATADSPWAECDFKNPFAALYHIGNTDAIPKWPETLSLQCQDLLRCCLIRDPSQRWSAKKLLDHEFLQNVYIPALHG